MANYWRIPLSTALLHRTESETLALQTFLPQQKTKGSFAMVCGQNNGGHWVTVLEDALNEFIIIDPSGPTVTVKSMDANRLDLIIGMEC